MRVVSWIIGIWIILGVYTGYGQSTHAFSGGASQLSTGFMTNNLPGVQAVYGNPASVNEIRKFAIDVGYIRRFNLAELSVVSLAGAYKTDFGTVGVRVNRFGFEAYSEMLSALTYSRKLYDNLSIGVGFDMLTYNAGTYGSTTKFTFDVGLQAKLGSDVYIAAHAFNPLEVEITPSGTVPGTLSLGVAYEAGGKATVAAEVLKRTDRPIEAKIAAAYDVLDNLSLHLAAQVNNSAIYFGVAYGFYEHSRVIGAYSYDNRLGSSPAVSLQYQD